MTIERLEFKAAFTADDTGAIEGIAWPFGSADRVGDIIEPSGFAGAVGKSLPMLFAHDQAQVVGTWESVTVEADGLKVKGRLLVDDVARAKEVRALVRAKSVTGLSVGFMTKKSAPRKGGGRTITDLDLLECSLVAIPAHPGAQISSVKDLQMTAENTKTVEELAVDLKAANDNIAAVTKRLETAETALARPAITGKAANDNEISEERKAFASYLRRGDNIPAEELKTLTIASDPGGGYLAPEEMSTEFIRNLVEFSPIRQFASVRTTGSPSVKYPKRNSITNATWEGELGTASASEPSFGQLEIPVRKLMTYVDISEELLADSAGAAEAEVRLALAEDFGSKEAVGFVNGNGVNQPEGVMTNAEIEATVNGHATNLSADKLIDLQYAMPSAYRNAPGAAWAMNGTTLAAVRKLKDPGTGSYLWQPSFQAGQPETVLGKPVIEMVDMPDIGDGEFPIIFGDWSAYRILDRVQLQVLVDPYTQKTSGVVRIHGTRRVGGRVMQAARFRKLKTAAS